MTPGEDFKQAFAALRRHLNDPPSGARYDETAIVPSPWTKFGLGVRRSEPFERGPTIAPRLEGFHWLWLVLFLLIGWGAGWSGTHASYVNDIYAGRVSTPQGVYRTEKVGK